MSKLSLKLKFLEILLFTSVIFFFIDVYFLFSIFFVTIPLSVLIGIIACIFSIKEKKYWIFIIDIILIIIPIIGFILIPW